eukprot:gene1034-1122_t
MSLSKRILFDLDSYPTLESSMDSDLPVTLESQSMNRLLGACHQLAFLSSYALEIFANIAALSDDLQNRLDRLGQHTDRVMTHAQEAVPRHLRQTDLDPDLSQMHNKSKYYKPRDLTVPLVFTRHTLDRGLERQYVLCRSPPALWRLESLTQTDCYPAYSFPGYFFQEWLKAEILRQEQAKVERRRQREARRQLKKKMKEERQLLSNRVLSARIAQHAGENRSGSLLSMARERRSLLGQGGIGQPQPSPSVTNTITPATPMTPSVAGEEKEASVSVPKRKGMAAVFSFLTQDKSTAKPAPQTKTTLAAQPEAPPASISAITAANVAVAPAAKKPQTTPTVITAGGKGGEAKKPVEANSSIQSSSDPLHHNAHSPSSSAVNMNSIQPVPLSKETSKPNASSTTKAVKRASISMEVLSLQMLTGASLSGTGVDGSRSSEEKILTPTPSAPPPALSQASQDNIRASRDSLDSAVPHSTVPHEGTGKLRFEESSSHADLLLLLPDPALTRKKPPPPPPPPSGGGQPLLKLLNKEKAAPPLTLLGRAGPPPPPSSAGPSQLPNTTLIEVGSGAKGVSHPSDGSSHSHSKLSVPPPPPNAVRAPSIASSASYDHSVSRKTGKPGRKRASVLLSPDFLKSLSMGESAQEEQEEEQKAAASMVEALRSDLLQSASLDSIERDASIISQVRSSSASALQLIVEEEDEEQDREQAPPRYQQDENEQDAVKEEGEDELRLLEEDNAYAGDDIEEDEKTRSSYRSSAYAPGPPPPPPPPPAPPAPARPVSMATGLLDSIRMGKVALRSTAEIPPPPKVQVKQNEAIAAILANRSKIAGSDSESSDSDDDYTDDDYG